jgi:NAD(P)-dependent dehydrogenase (short-subunit alcohol dehydrogenase family)
MDLGLAGKTAVVTGAGQGFGLAIAAKLVEEGVRVTGGDLVVTDELRDLGEAVLPVQVDLSTVDGPPELVERAIGKHGRLDILVNNVGISPQYDGFLDISEVEWARTFNTNFFSAVRAARATLPHFVDHGGGVIVNICSVLWKEPIKEMVDYCSAKAALRSLTQVLSEEFGPHGVRVTSVSPGPGQTPQWVGTGGQAEQWAAAMGVTKEEVIDRIAPETFRLSVGRLVLPSDVADAVAFLVSPRAAGINGADLGVTCGMWKSL